jgi:hypothetical protein
MWEISAGETRCNASNKVHHSRAHVPKLLVQAYAGPAECGAGFTIPLPFMVHACHNNNQPLSSPSATATGHMLTVESPHELSQLR